MLILSPVARWNASRFAVAVALAAPLALGACGARVAVDGSSTSGAGGGAATAGSTTATSSGGGGSPCPAACPMFPPGGSTPCACSAEACPYDQCPQDGPLITATCVNGLWSLQTEMCTPIPCGTTQCTPGFVCLHTMSGVGDFASCIPNPCGTMPLSCACATAVCPQGKGTVCSAKIGELFCGCTMCP